MFNDYNRWQFSNILNSLASRFKKQTPIDVIYQNIIFDIDKSNETFPTIRLDRVHAITLLQHIESLEEEIEKLNERLLL